MSEVKVTRTSVYVDLNQADEYFEASHDTTWQDETDNDDVKARATITASRLLDRHVVWKDNQALAWPLGGPETPLGDYTDELLQHAVCCLAETFFLKTGASGGNSGSCGGGGGGGSAGVDGIGKGGGSDGGYGGGGGGG